MTPRAPTRPATPDLDLEPLNISSPPWWDIWQAWADQRDPNPSRFIEEKDPREQVRVDDLAYQLAVLAFGGGYEAGEQLQAGRIRERDQRIERLQQRSSAWRAALAAEQSKSSAGRDLSLAVRRFLERSRFGAEADAVVELQSALAAYVMRIYQVDQSPLPTSDPSSPSFDSQGV